MRKPHTQKCIGNVMSLSIELQNIIGIDPGLQGYICDMGCDENGCETMRFTKMPLCPRYGSREGRIVDVVKLDEVIRAGSIVFIEELFVGFKQSNASVMTSSENLGRVLGLLEMKGCAVHLVQPRVWQKALSESFGYEWTKGSNTKVNALG